MTTTPQTTEIALLKQSMEYTNEKLDSIDRKLDHSSKQLELFIISVRSEYVTKNENNALHKLNQERIDKHDYIISRIAWASLFGLITIIAWIIWVTKSI